MRITVIAGVDINFDIYELERVATRARELYDLRLEGYEAYQIWEGENTRVFVRGEAEKLLDRCKEIVEAGVEGFYAEYEATEENGPEADRLWEKYGNKVIYELEGS